METQPSKSMKGFVAAVVGTIVVALCCFTPVLVVAFSVIGLGFATRYLDYVILPALAAMLIVTVMAYRKWRRST